MKPYYLRLVLLFLLPICACAQDRLALQFPEQRAAPGEQVCVPVYAANFENILTMQYSIGWDSKVLRFVKVADFALPGMTEQNFGRPGEHPDRLTVSWFEPNLAAATVPDGTALFNVCFEVVGTSGARTALSITDHPTVVEIANAQEEVLQPVLKEGGVVVE